MVILVPFLLITAVFSRITILDLNLPSPGQPEPTTQREDEEPLQLEVILRENTVEIGDRKRGRLKLVTVSDDGSYLDEISTLLQQVKARVPDQTGITLLVETDIPYQRLVTVMDTLRAVRVLRDGAAVNAELFPDIAIGDAPPGARHDVNGRAQ
jgi:biopolymer transport protein ExbD